MPRHNLRKVSTIIKAFAKKHNINYEERTFWKANVKLYKSLRETATHTKDLVQVEGGLYKLKLWEGFNAFG